MLSKKEIKNLYIFLSISFSLVFLFLEQNHSCGGDGCLICLFSLIVHLVTNVLLLIKFLPTIVEKIVLYVSNSFLTIENDKNKESTFNVSFNPYINITTDLISFGVKQQ